MEPSSKKRKLAPKVNTSVAPNPQPAAQYSHETVSLASLPQHLDYLLLPSLFHPPPLSIVFFALTTCTLAFVANSLSPIPSRHNNSLTPYTMLRLPNDKTSRPLRVICRMRPC